MIPRVLLAITLSIAGVGGALGCHHHARTNDSSVFGSSDTMPSAVNDSIVGTVSVTGTSFEQRIVLRAGESARMLALSRDDSSAFAKLGGVELVARGIANADAFAVHSFTVRAVDGAPVHDGVLERKDGRLVLVARSGTLTLGNPPTALDSLVHARIWIGGPLDSGPNSYGIIKR